MSLHDVVTTLHVDVNSSSDELTQFHLLHEAIDRTNKPPQYIPRQNPTFETCAYIFKRGMYHGERCYNKPIDGKRYCNECHKRRAFISRIL